MKKLIEKIKQMFVCKHRNQKLVYYDAYNNKEHWVCRRCMHVTVKSGKPTADQNKKRHYYKPKPKNKTT